MSVSTSSQNIPTNLPSVRIVCSEGTVEVASVLSQTISEMKPDDPFFAGLTTSKSNGNKVESVITMEHEEQVYYLEKNWDDGACVIHVKKSCMTQALNNLFEGLTRAAKTNFCSYFVLEEIGKITTTSAVVSGDLDGSVVRQIVSGMLAGMIATDKVGMELLTFLINAESDMLDVLNTSSAMDGYKALQVFQENKVLQETLEKLLPHLEFKPGHTLFISIGDGAHDRFSFNKDADRYIREQLKTCGAIFILGNHDVFYSKVNSSNDERNLPYMVANGYFGKDNASVHEWVTHQQTVFCNTFYHAATNTLYIHHGLDLTDDDYLVTVFGQYPVPLTDNKFNLDDFINWVNAQPIPRPEELCIPEGNEATMANFEYNNRFIGFRPTKEKMLIISQKVRIGIAHGHDGAKDTVGNVLRLNARTIVDGRLRYVPAAACVGEFFQ